PARPPPRDARAKTQETRMKTVQNFRPGPRLALGFGFALLMLALTAVLAAIQIGRVNESARRFAVDTVPSLRAVGSLRVGLQDIRRAQASYVMARSEAAMDEAAEAIARARARQ